MIGKLSTQHKQSKPFKPRVHQGKGQSLINSGRVTNIITTIEADSVTESGHATVAEVIMEKIRTSEVGPT